MAITASVMPSSGHDGRLWTKGSLGVRIRYTTSVCVSRPTTNQPDWNSVWFSGVLAWNTYHISAKVRMSNTELMGPKNTMKRPRSFGFHCSGWRTSSSSTLSNGMAICEMSYSRFCTSRCSGSMGKNGKNALAISTENTLPKLELAVMRMYFSMLLKVLRPSTTPSSSTIRLFSSRMMSAASLAMSTPPSTLMPMSAARSAGASLMPSPRKPTTCPLSRSACTMRSLCSGVSLANTLCCSTNARRAGPSKSSICAPRITWSTAKPTSRHTLAATRSLSPVSTFTATPCAARASRAGAVDSFGGSRKAM